MTGRDAAMMAAGSAVLVSSTVAMMIIWMLLARPVDLVNAANGQDVAGFVQLAAATLYDMLLRFLDIL